MNTGKISVRYARALYAAAQEQGCEETVFAQMQHLSEVFFQMPELAAALANPLFAGDEKVKLLLTASGSDVHPLLNQFFHFVVQKERESLFQFMVMSFLDIYRKEKDIVLGKIISAIELDDKVFERLKSFIRKKSGVEAVLSRQTDDKLIGGFVLEINNSRLDASVRTRLREIENHLTRK
ncbi:MAG: F0F1 ATP synthase subunit delta [Paludibacteraceae bacterium]|nr:F0F1 ATP synthase subunit delta [Paludibacteraceae bacterium]